MLIKIEEKANSLARKKHFICPVCGGILGNRNFPTKTCVLDDKLYRYSKARFIDSTVRIEYSMYHYYDEEADRVKDDYHLITGQFEMVFNYAGECIVFDVLGVLPCKKDIKKVCEAH